MCSSGAALEYFGCAALTAERQRELRTLDLSAMLWRPVEMQTLHILKAPNKPAALPGKCRVVRFGFWCKRTSNCPPQLDLQDDVFERSDCL